MIMCLSTVYKVNGNSSEMFCKNIQNVLQDKDSGEIKFRDIMGIEYSLMGRIASIDLVDNNIMVEEA